MIGSEGNLFVSFFKDLTGFFQGNLGDFVLPCLGRFLCKIRVVGWCLVYAKMKCNSFYLSGCPATTSQWAERHYVKKRNQNPDLISKLIMVMNKK